MIAACSGCGHQQDVGARVVGKVAMLLATAILGGKYVKRHPKEMLGLVVAATAFGHWLDQKVLPACPNCERVLELVGPFV